MNRPQEEALQLAEKMAIKLTAEEKDLREKQLLKVRVCFLFFYLLSLYIQSLSLRLQLILVNINNTKFC